MKKIYIVGSVFIIVVLVGTFFLIGTNGDPTKKIDDSSNASSAEKKLDVKKNKNLAQKNIDSVKKSSDLKISSNTKKKTKVFFKKPKSKFKVKKSLFPKGRIKNFPWRKGRPVLAKNLKPSKGKMPAKYNFQNEVNPKWESLFRDGLSQELNGQKINTDKKNSIIIANGNKAIFAEEVGVTIGKDKNEVRMIVNSENGNVIHRYSENEDPSTTGPDSNSGSGEIRGPSSGGGSSSSDNDEPDSTNLWSNYSGFHYAKDGDLKSLEGKKEDEQSLSPRVEMTAEEKEAYQKSLEN